jgi:hypothetical protein
MLAEGGFAKQPASGLTAEEMDALVLRVQEFFKSQLRGRVSETARMRPVEHPCARGIHQLKHVLPVKGKERRVHDLEDAPQQRGCLERADALPLQQVGERIDLTGEFSE